MALHILPLAGITQLPVTEVALGLAHLKAIAIGEITEVEQFLTLTTHKFG